MSSGVLPPVPDLIPISLLRKNSPARTKSSNNSERSPVKRVSSVSAVAPEVMGEQRSRRRSANQAAVELIDSAGSRGASAAPQALHSRKARSERHRKSDRRREHGKPARTGSTSSKHSKSRETNCPGNSSPERPVNPRVNPIFVWVRQEDTHIVDVKCEDYDKRNRILLTKTAQGWRAIPRTETLVPSLKEAASREIQHHHHHTHHKHKKSRKNKIRRRSTGVQVSSDIEPDEEDRDVKNVEIEKQTPEVNTNQQNSPSWICPEIVNVESLLPSHTIKIKRSTSSNNSPERETNVNSAVREAQSQSLKCSADKISDVTPLENLLAVAELEFNQQIQSGEWNKTNETGRLPTEDAADDSFEKTFANDNDVDQKDFIKDLEQLNDLIQSEENKLELETEYEPHQIKTECDYNDDDDNNIAMDDILSRLEQSLRSPECIEVHNTQKNFTDKNEVEEEIKNIEDYVNESESDLKSIPELDTFFEETDHKMAESIDEHKEQNNLDAAEDHLEENSEEPTDEPSIEPREMDAEEPPEELVDESLEEPSSVPIVETIEVSSDESKSVPQQEEELEKTEIIDLIESTMEDDDEPKDLSFKSSDTTVENICESLDHEEPTDLSVPKPLSIRPLTPLRPPSQSSEAIQSPQPSGIPAIPQSPDTVSTSISNASVSSCKSKSVFLESLLSTTTKKIALNSEVTIIRQKEPLDLGNSSRKSASPTITCSEEINNRSSESEPPPKKMKSVDITLKTLLDADVEKGTTDDKNNHNTPENSRLLELLNIDEYIDPLSQLKQLLSDSNVSIPDPMLVPKDRFTQILTNPATEIPKLLKERPELRLPEALAYPHIMQDPNMLVLNIHHLQSILSSKHSIEVRNNDPTQKQSEKSTKRNDKLAETSKEPPTQSTKKKNLEHSTKSLPKESHEKNINELASDIDAATQAAFNQMMWLPYLNQLEAMSMGSNSDIMKSFANSLNFPFYPNQVPDFGHLFGTARMPMTPLGFPLQSSMGYGSQLEFNMWQEAMLQANLLRNKNNIEHFNNKQMFKDYLEKMNSPPVRKPSANNNLSQKSHSSHKQPDYSTGMFPNESPFQNQYVNMNFLNSGNSSRQNIHMPHYGTAMHHKNLMSHQKPESNFPQKNIGTYQSHQRQDRMVDNNQNYSNMFTQVADQEKNQYLQSLNMMNSDEHHYVHNVSQNHRKESNNHLLQKPKLSCKSFANLSHSKSVPHHDHKQKDKNNSSSSEFSKQQTSQPIDLSGSTTSGSKLKVKQHLIDPTNTPKLLKHQDDIPEVGSTTASIEEMQDAHKHLWHPLFGNHKGYNSPWNWTTVTAAGE